MDDETTDLAERVELLRRALEEEERRHAAGEAVAVYEMAALLDDAFRDLLRALVHAGAPHGPTTCSSRS